MSDDFSARLALPYLAAGQMQKHVTLNEALTRLDALAATAVISRTTTAQPDNPADGDLYILPEGATGAAWADRLGGALMRFEGGGWTVVPAPDGLVALVLDAGEAVVRTDGGWRPLGERLGAIQNLTRLGVGAEADAVNPVAVRANKMLFTAQEAEADGDGDLRLTLNKQGAADVLSLLFQSGYGGRAELGLVGGDDLSLKVSADGNGWAQAFAVDRTTGRVSFDFGATRCETTVFSSDGDYAPPPWARRIEAVCVGGGGGGGSGMVGANGTARFGGGGGGAGGLSQAHWPASALNGSLSVTVGAGGAGGPAGSGAGAIGASGGNSSVASGEVVLLSAGGGGGGSTGSGAAGVGGVGTQPANPGGTSSLTTSAGAGLSTVCAEGPGGGGAGGGISASNAARAGGDGGAGAYVGLRTSGGSGGAGAGGKGQAPMAPNLSLAGGGGAGGGASAGGAGFSGGSGGAFGAGGGGGGAGLTAAGAGGAGGAGLVRITAIG